MASLPLPPWRQLPGVLAPAEHAALLGWTLENRSLFQPSKVVGAGYSPDLRVSERVKAVGPMRPLLEPRIRALLPDILAGAGSKPFEPDFIEFEIAAHGDGAFFKPHTDVPVGPGRRRIGGDRTGRHERVVSAVLYYHREPKAFSGGALRLFRFAAPAAPEYGIDVEPVQNSLVVFPSWAVHEVTRVSCPGDRFEDRRFAVNIWLCREIPVDS
jgi:Rps23 Pro-64 3,4-dihydroxylase Tpa1-like proline 4-hydroxylase